MWIWYVVAAIFALVCYGALYFQVKSEKHPKVHPDTRRRIDEIMAARAIPAE